MVEFSNVYVERLWSFALSVQSIQSVHGFYLRLLPQIMYLLNASLLRGLMHQRVWLVKDVLLARSSLSFFAPFLLAACFPGVDTTH